MSASQEKRKRKGLDEDRRTARAREESEKSRKNRRIYTIVGAIFVVFVAVVILFSSNLFYRHFTAVEIGNTKYHVTDYNYYYNVAYLNYYNTYYSYYGEQASDYMPDEDTLKEETLGTMQEITMLYEEAQANGYTLSEEELQEVDETITSMKEGAEENGYPSFNNYLSTFYGKGMNEAIFRENLTRYAIATNYADVLQDSFTYSAKELTDYYEAHKDAYDIINYRMYTFVSNEDAEDVAEEDIITADEAEELANEFAGKVTDEASFAELAREYADAERQEAYADDDATLSSYSGETVTAYLPNYADWLLASERKEGDVTVLGDSGVYAVLYFVSRNGNEYETVNARHILVALGAIDESAYENDEAGLEEARQVADDMAKTTADEIYNEWKNGDATEESFAALADEYSTDAAEGGYYENIYHGQMTSEFDSWIFDPARKVGDVGIVRSEQYGYHIIYFSGYGMVYRDLLAEQDLRSEDYKSWKENRSANYEPVTTWLLGLA